MSVSRTITIRLVTKRQTIGDLIQNLFEAQFLLSDNDGVFKIFAEDEFQNFDQKEVFIKATNDRMRNWREVNIICYDLKCDEAITVGVDELENPYTEYDRHYRINLILGVGKRIANSNGHTDFSCYLDRLLPALDNDKDSVCEVTCQDYVC